MNLTRFVLAECTVFLSVVFSTVPSADMSIATLYDESGSCIEDNCAVGRHAVVFIHGLTGNKQTWVNSSGFNWVENFAKDDDLIEYDVYQIEYESNLLTSSATLSQINRELWSQFSTLISKNYDSIAIVAHSLGGNIARRYLQTLKSKTGHTFLNKFRVVALLGTPMEGSKLANLFKFITSNPTVPALASIDQNDYLELINEQIDGTINKHEDAGCPSLRFYAAYEKEKTFPIGIIVSEESATRGAYACVGISNTHTGISKPENESSKVYSLVKKLLLKCADSDRSVCPTPESRIPMTCKDMNVSLEEHIYLAESCFRSWD